MIFFDTPHLDELEKIIHVLGIPAIFGAIIWLVRTYDSGQRTLKDIQDRGESSETLLTATKSAVDTIQTNHLKHLEDATVAMAVTQGETNRILTSVDKGISILVDRNNRG